MIKNWLIRIQAGSLIQESAISRASLPRFGKVFPIRWRDGKAKKDGTLHHLGNDPSNLHGDHEDQSGPDSPTNNESVTSRESGDGAE